MIANGPQHEKNYLRGGGGGLRTTKVQTSLRFLSVPLLFAYWELLYLDLL